MVRPLETDHARLERCSVKLRPLAVSAALVAVISLSGCVGAAIGAGATVGVAASQDRGLGGAIDDTKIRVEINNLWFRHNVDMYRKVDLDIMEGRVMLTGAVPTVAMRDEAVKLTWQAPGVRQVIDDIQVLPQGVGLAEGAHDTVVAEKMKADLLFDRQIQNINYDIEVVNGTIYLLGIAANQQELDRVLGYASTISGVKQVVNHVLLRSSTRRVSG
jgi:osmotically-inducible protein OsmY